MEVTDGTAHVAGNESGPALPAGSRNGHAGHATASRGGRTNSGVGKAPRAEGSGLSVTRVAIQRPMLMLMTICAVLIFGVIGYTRMGVDLFPAVNFPVVLSASPTRAPARKW